jgi:hypothetical protein
MRQFFEVALGALISVGSFISAFRDHSVTSNGDLGTTNRFQSWTLRRPPLPTSGRITFSAGAKVRRTICVLGQSCPAGQLADAAVQENGDVILAYASGAVARVKLGGRAELLPDLSPSSRLIPRRLLLGTSVEMRRVVGTHNQDVAVMTPTSWYLSVEGRDRATKARHVEWPQSAVEGSMGGMNLAALLIPAGQSAQDSVEASVAVWSEASTRWATRARFLARPRSVRGSVFVPNPGPFRTHEKWVVDANANVWIADAVRPRIYRYDGSGTSTLVAWTAVRVPITPHEVDSLRMRLYASELDLTGPSRDAMRRNTDRLMDALPRERPAISDLIATSDGSVWVRKAGPPGEARSEWMPVSREGKIGKSFLLPSTSRMLDANAAFLLATAIGPGGVIRIEAYPLPTPTIGGDPSAK